MAADSSSHSGNRKPNHLASETSPYLQQHAYNPVEWYPWGTEALDKARAEDKPILVSIGYSACHWCHVMERESFEDPVVAAVMNERFVNIKIDREERPDLDQLYMNAVQVMTGSGGWPLNVFLTPDARPFTGGTYFPPQDLSGRPSWPTVLRRVHETFVQKRTHVEEQANLLLDHLRNLDTRFTGPVERLDTPGDSDSSDFLPADLPDRIAETMLKQADRHYGGFGAAPKFPGVMNLRFLLRQGHASGKVEATEHAMLSLECMGAGGIYDHLGGGFARYSTDAHWLAPHFEKMLYDNALLLAVYAEACQVESRPRFVQIIDETIGFAQRELGSPEGAFYATLDADSEGVEGKFYTWSADEIRAVLGDQSDRFSRFYGVREGGNWEGVNILHRSLSIEEFARQEGLSAEVWEQDRRLACEQLFEHRSHMIRPGLDDKIILSWNAMMASGLYRAAAALDGIHPKADAWRFAADRCLDFLGKSLRQGDRMLRVWQQGRPRFDAVLDDYATYIAALTDRYESGFEDLPLEEAVFWTEHVLAQFSDEDERYFHYTPQDQTDVVLRTIDHYDGATPSGNAVMADNLLRLGRMTGRQVWTNRGLTMLSGMAATVSKYGTSFGAWACSMQEELSPRREVAIVGPRYAAYARTLQRRFIPGTIFMGMSLSSDKVTWPLLQNRGVDGETLLYVCRDFACEQPVAYPEQAIW